MVLGGTQRGGTTVDDDATIRQKIGSRLSQWDNVVETSVQRFRCEHPVTKLKRQRRSYFKTERFIQGPVRHNFQEAC